MSFAAPRAPLQMVFLVLVCALSACARLPDRSENDEIQFEFVARLGMRYGDDAGSGTLFWRHSDVRDDVLLTSPLGQGLAEIRRDTQSVSVALADGRRLVGRDAEMLTEEALGFRLPLAGFSDWVLGRESDAFPAARIERDAAGLARSIVQGGWRVDYLSYDSNAKDEALPAQMRLYFPAASEAGLAIGAKSVELRVAISEWRVRPKTQQRSKSGQR